ncbi:DUF6402 family protein [Pseudomonas sp. NPDC089406]|uniref:DUF6402 family protein n=1 Tax=Pseudomonas sp. NPDC089406 TaxID=3364463 RepID=UPI003850EFEF
MANETAQSNLSPSNNKQGSVVQSRQFKITDIPDAMDKMGWPVSAKLMRHWFKGRPWDTPDGGMDHDVKKHIAFAPDEFIEESIVKMSWVMNYARAREKMAVLEANWNNANAQIEITAAILKFVDGKPPGSYPIKFNGLASKAERFPYFNSRSVEFNQTGDDDLNDLRGALANFNLRVIAEGNVAVLTDSIIFTASTLGFYVEDSYDFVDDTFWSQPLGFWNFDGIAPSIASAMATNNGIDQMSSASAMYSMSGNPQAEARYREIQEARYFLITNGSFAKYRKIQKKGGDFRVFSDIYYKPLASPVTIKVK